MSKHRRLQKEIIYWHDAIAEDPRDSGEYLVLKGSGLVSFAYYEASSGVWLCRGDMAYGIQAWASKPLGPD